MADLIDGTLRLSGGVLERYIKGDDLWVLPDQYAFFQTSHNLVRNFGAVQILECNTNMYSVGCWENMYQVFRTGNNGKEILDFVVSNNIFWDFVLNLMIGDKLFWIWLFIGAPVI